MSRRPFHLAGVIPCVAQRRELGFPWDDYLHPVGDDYLAVERSVAECAFVGCNTIWIILDRRSQPIIKKRIGESIIEPMSHFRAKENCNLGHRFEIPIYYVPIHPKDAYQRDSQIWSMIYGSRVANRVSGLMSDWLRPNRFYVSNPYGLYKVRPLGKQKRSVRSKKRFFVSHKGQDYRDGLYTAFTYTSQEVEKWYKIFRSKEVRQYDPSTFEARHANGAPKNPRRLPIEKRYSGRRMKLEDVFAETDLYDGCEEVVEYEIDHYGNIDNWKNYVEYLKNADWIERKPKGLFSNRYFTRIGAEEEKETI